MKVISKATNKNSKRPKGAVIKTVASKTKKSFKEILNDRFRLLKDAISKFDKDKVLYAVNTFILLLVLMGAYSAAIFLKDNLFIEKVVVKGDFVQIDKKDIENHLDKMVGSNYFDINIKNIKKTLKEFSWLESAEVRRIWPDTLAVEIKEHHVIATWGEDSFVNDKGEIFSPISVNRNYLKNIPDLNGNKMQSEVILNTYVMLSNYSKKEQLKINSFSLNSNSYWVLGFQNGIELLIACGREEASLLTFLEIYREQDLFIDDKKMRIDMRYTNGFSLGLIVFNNDFQGNTGIHSIYRSGNNHG